MRIFKLPVVVGRSIDWFCCRQGSKFEENLVMETCVESSIVSWYLLLRRFYVQESRDVSPTMHVHPEVVLGFIGFMHHAGVHDSLD
jgi:hypothetical protein